MSHYELNVTGMTCEHCVAAVREELDRIDQVGEVTVTLRPGHVSTVSVDTTADVPRQDLIEAVAEAGYDVIPD